MEGALEMLQGIIREYGAKFNSMGDVHNPLVIARRFLNDSKENQKIVKVVRDELRDFWMAVMSNKPAKGFWTANGTGQWLSRARLFYKIVIPLDMARIRIINSGSLGHTLSYKRQSSLTFCMSKVDSLYPQGKQVVASDWEELRMVWRNLAPELDVPTPSSVLEASETLGVVGAMKIDWVDVPHDWKDVEDSDKLFKSTHNSLGSVVRRFRQNVLGNGEE